MGALTPNVLTPQDLEPNWRWENRLPAWGHTSVDFERRVDHDRLRRYRLSRTRQALKASNAGTLLLFDVNWFFFPLRSKSMGLVGHYSPQMPIPASGFPLYPLTIVL